MSDIQINSMLIVDDEPELLEVLKDIFTDAGFKVFAASSGMEALEIYKNNKDIHVIISDSQMSGMTGLEFLKKLKETYHTIPLFYLATGSIEQSDEDLKSLGGAGLVLKPFDVDEILIKIKNDLGL